MPAVQTSYSERMAPGLNGQPATMVTWNDDTRVCEEDSGIGFGLAVQQGVGDKGALLGAAAATDFVGVTVRDVTLDPATHAAVGVDKYAKGDNMAVRTMGDIYIAVESAVVAGDNVTFNATTGKLSSAATSGSQFAITGARWMSSASAGAIARLRLSGHMQSA